VSKRLQVSLELYLTPLVCHSVSGNRRIGIQDPALRPQCDNQEVHLPGSRFGQGMIRLGCACQRRNLLFHNTLADRSPYLFYQHCQKRLPAIGICDRSLRKTSFAKYVVRWKAEFRLRQPNHFNLCRSGGWSKGGLCRCISRGSFQRSTGTPDHLTERLSWPSTHLSQSSSFS
jgi:hypothetical protein